MRELENAICRAIVLETTDLLGADHLAPDGPAASRDVAGRVVPLAEVERQKIAHALEVFDRSQMRAAAALGINRATLHRKLRKQDGT